MKVVLKQKFIGHRGFPQVVTCALTIVGVGLHRSDMTTGLWFSKATCKAAIRTITGKMSSSKWLNCKVWFWQSLL